MQPHLLVSDPPYGVEYDPDWRNRAGASDTKRTGKVLNDHRADWREFWVLFPGEVAYVWHGALHASTVADSLLARDFEIRSQSSGQRNGTCSGGGTTTGSTSPAGTRCGAGALERGQDAVDPLVIPSRDQDAATIHGTQKPVECEAMSDADLDETLRVMNAVLGAER